jgi:hypothetical protein
MFKRLVTFLPDYLRLLRVSKTLAGKKLPRAKLPVNVFYKLRRSIPIGH